MKRNLKNAVVLLLCISFFAGSAQADESKDSIQVPAVSEIDDISNELFHYQIDDRESTDFKPFEGVIEPDHPLYQLKIAFENIDETFTYADVERLDKKISALDRRIAEAESEIEKGDEKSADMALSYYIDELKDIEITLQLSNISGIDLKNLNKSIQKQELKLQNLIQPQTLEKIDSDILIALDGWQKLMEVMAIEIEESEYSENQVSNNNFSNDPVLIDDSDPDNNSGPSDGSDPNDNSGSSDGSDSNGNSGQGKDSGSDDG